MIEINLIPDVKLEYLKAQRQKRNVISLSIIVAMVAGALVVLLGFYVFVVQTVTMSLADGSIDSETKKLQQVDDLAKTLTIQQQMSAISSLHNDKLMSSRLFEVLKTIVPRGENEVSVSSLSLNTEDSTITIEGEAENGYEALDVFKKTIAKTRFEYLEDGQKQGPIAISTGSIIDGERRYGQSTNGDRVLRFSLSFTYPVELFAHSSTSGKVIAPNRQNATDSAAGVPKSLFTNGESDGGFTE